MKSTSAVALVFIGIIVLQHALLHESAVAFLNRTILQYVDVRGDDAEVQFLLFTKDTIDSPKISTVDDTGTLFEGTFNNSKVTKFVIHGWLDSWTKPFAQTILSAFLPKHDFNVIVVDWPAADNILYWPSREKVTPIGRITAQFMERLVKEYELNLSSIHVIGHSLGAHVAGVAGYNVQDKIGKITGLEPALPLFRISGPDSLTRNAAKFVEVLHTCGHYLGMFDAIGHVDFYANGGTPFQPGCFLNLSCSHKRAFELYAESIVNSTAFLGTECGDWNTYLSHGCKQNTKSYINEEISTRTRGTFFFKTAATSPYGLGLDS